MIAIEISLIKVVTDKSKFSDRTVVCSASYSIVSLGMNFVYNLEVRDADDIKAGCRTDQSFMV